MKARIKLRLDPGTDANPGKDFELLELVLKIPKKYLTAMGEAYMLEGTTLEDKLDLMQGDFYVQIVELIE